jgi:Tol biopolymer transport system component
MRGRVLFKSNRLGIEETYALDPDSGSVARINADWAWPLAAQQLTPSPDGQSAAIVKADSNGILQIFVRSLVYGTETQITTFRQQDDKTRSYDPAWSPTGEWIAFVSTNSGNDEIYRVTPDGSVVEQLTFNQWEWDKHPSWSPDGTQIVFYSNRETQRRQLWIMNADGSGQHALAPSPGDDWDPVWTR